MGCAYWGRPDEWEWHPFLFYSITRQHHNCIKGKGKGKGKEKGKEHGNRESFGYHWFALQSSFNRTASRFAASFKEEMLALVTKHLEDVIEAKVFYPKFTCEKSQRIQIWKLMSWWLIDSTKATPDKPTCNRFMRLWNLLTRVNRRMPLACHSHTLPRWNDADELR